MGKGCFLPSSLFGGAAQSGAHYPAFFGVVLLSPSLPPSPLSGGARPPPPFGGAAFLRLFSMVLLSPSHLWVVLVIFGIERKLTQAVSAFTKKHFDVFFVSRFFLPLLFHFQLLSHAIVFSCFCVFLDPVGVPSLPTPKHRIPTTKQSPSLCIVCHFTCFSMFSYFFIC